MGVVTGLHLCAKTVVRFLVGACLSSKVKGFLRKVKHHLATVLVVVDHQVPEDATGYFIKASFLPAALVLKTDRGLYGCKGNSQLLHVLIVSGWNKANKKAPRSPEARQSFFGLFILNVR